jgi:hypothetical protein
MSPSTLRQHFRAITGVSLLQFLLKAQLFGEQTLDLDSCRRKKIANPACFTYTPTRVVR